MLILTRTSEDPDTIQRLACSSLCPFQSGVKVTPVVSAAARDKYRTNVSRCGQISLFDPSIVVTRRKCSEFNQLPLIKKKIHMPEPRVARYRAIVPAIKSRYRGTFKIALAS
jgi:hypothetical protein